MTYAGMRTDKNGNIGDIMEVPATVEPFLPTPPLRNTVAKLMMTQMAVEVVKRESHSHNSTPKRLLLHTDEPKNADKQWIVIIVYCASVTSNFPKMSCPVI